MCAEKEMQAAHYRVTVEEDGSKRWCTFGFKNSGLDYPVKIVELDEAGQQVLVSLCLNVQLCARWIYY